MGSAEKSSLNRARLLFTRHGVASSRGLANVSLSFSDILEASAPNLLDGLRPLRSRTLTKIRLFVSIRLIRTK
jgi:hypothetical protein